MDAELRKKVEERAYALWDEAGRPDGSALLYWLRAEQEFGIVPKVQADDPLITLQELATEAHALEESEICRQVRGRCRPRSMRLSRLPNSFLAARTEPDQRAR